MNTFKGHENTVGQVGRILFDCDGTHYELITVKQAALEFETTERTIQRWIDEGILIGLRVSRMWLIVVRAHESIVETLDENPF